MPELTPERPPVFSQEWRPESNEAGPETRRPSRITFRPLRINWPLLLGGLIVLLITLVAIAGPTMAPGDPLEENAIIRVGEEWKIPPFPAFTPGFFLGSDQFGRDLLSRLLWAVRPTMVMVVVVAAVRLVLGVFIGLGAGWFTGWVGRALDTVIGAALSVPVLMVALGAIAAVGIEVGIWAFIIGLAINGWVETARLVREQTRLVKGQLYVEAARALGASDSQVILRHVLRQIMPMVWMLLAFEISGTLMVTAALGFLGYYMGGDVWVVVEDTVARRTSGTPELGQMLATSWVRADEPWAMIAVGSVIFVAVLGFNLLGRGLRGRLSLKRRTLLGRARAALSSQVTEPVGRWMNQRVWSPLVRQTRRRAFFPALIGVLILITAGLIGWRLQATPSNHSAGSEGGVEPGQLWSSERSDSHGTLWNYAPGPVTPEIQWVFADPAGFAGGPAISDTGIVYVTSRQGTLYALDSAGQTRWQISLPVGGVGTPALDAAGHIYVSDRAGNLSAFSPAGVLRWRFRPGADESASSGPIVGPDGTVYYMLRGTSVQAVTPAGQGLWNTRALRDPIYSPPRLSASGDYLFVKDKILDATDGSLQEWSTPVEVDQYLTGADGQNYLQSGNEIYQWRPVASGVETSGSTTWDYRKFTIRVMGGPTDTGVTPQQLVWLLYSGKMEDTRIVWLNMSGRTLGNAHYAQRQTRVIAVDQDATTYACGMSRFGAVECLALKPGTEKPIWQVVLEQGGSISGGALVPGRLYVAMEDGFLYAMGEGQPSQQVADQDLEPVEIPVKLPGPDTEKVAWTFEDPTGFSSQPAVSDDGRVYIASTGGTFYAIDPAGNTLWQADLPAAPVGPPALSATGEIYQADKKGNLSAFAPDGSVRWRFKPPESKPSSVGPLVGPDGTIYYTIGSSVQAVSPNGEGLWQTQAQTFRSFTPLQLSPTGELLFFAEDVFDTRDGTLLELESPVDVDHYIVGNDSQTYLRSGQTVMQWRRTGSSIEIIQTAQWNYDGVVSYQANPTASGVTRDGTIWLMYTTPWGADTFIAWVDLEGQMLGIAGPKDPFSAGNVIGVRDQDAAIFICGLKNRPQGYSPVTIQCNGFVPGSEDPIWQAELDKTEEIKGGALAPGRLYLATREGVLYAVGESYAVAQITPAVPSDAQPTPQAEPEEGIETLPVTPEAMPVPTAIPADRVNAGDTLTYTLPIVNSGPSMAPGVVVTDALPTGVSLVSAASSQGAGCVALTGVVVCDLGDLASGASATITIVVAVDLSTWGTITHTATAASRAIDPDTADNLIDRATTVRGEADLSVTQIDTPDPVVAGRPLTYTLRIANRGPENATGVTLTSTLPVSTTFVSANGDRELRCAPSPDTVHCHLGNLASDSSTIVYILVTVDPSATGAILHSAAVTANEPDFNLLDNIVAEETAISAEADLTITR